MHDVEELFSLAMLQQVSDIHIEPFENYSRIRFRCDGLLSEVATLSSDDALQLTARIKIMAHLNIAEKRLPQDGRIKLKNYTLLDLRINTCPVLYGEKLVIRLQQKAPQDFSISALGLNAAQEKYFLNTLQSPQGLIIVTGPTGSGKTITLYTALQYLNTIEKNISTAEDPIEIALPHINQINVNMAIGFDFAAILRTILRQDPDVIMIGEIRDAETAAIAIRAAQTGHLVLSTLHCRHGAEAISRLQSLGVTPEQLATSLSLIISQRLIRKLSNNTYAGRTGIFEFSSLSSHDLPLRLNNPTQTSLWDSGREKIALGITDEKELIRVLGKSDHDNF